MAFRDNIRDARIQKGWTQEKAAAQIGAPHKSVQSWEYGTAHPRWAMLKKIIDGYKIPKSEIYKFLFQ